jgi:transposase InsO family protein
VTDITQFSTKHRVLYASAIKDLYDGSIVSYATGRDQTTSLVLRTVKRALASTGGHRQLILHSDQGSQYTSAKYHKALAKAGITASMSRPGLPADNAPIESFFSSMKTEWIRKSTHMTFHEVARQIREYIYFYNNTRIQLSSGLPPAEKRIGAA